MRIRPARDGPAPGIPLWSLSMKNLLVGLAALPFLAGVALAGQSMPLSDTQMDKVTAGGGIEFETEPFGIELNVYTQVGPAVFSFALEAGGDDTTGHTFCLGACPPNENANVLGLTHAVPIGPWQAVPGHGAGLP